MKNLDKIVEECTLDIESLGIELGTISSVTVNTRAKSRWGQCRRRGNTYLINICSDLLSDDVDDMAVKNTVAHELLHTIKGGMKHTGEWLAAAKLLNNAYGYNVKRSTTNEEKGIDRSAISYKYVIACKDCGLKYYYSKMSKCVKYVKLGSDRFRCGRCSGRLQLVSER